ncbi:MAG: endo-1,4-beta-xylanase [bacterium]|nr:endo-1,4-beta-xylanase [bacterium]
MSKFWVVVLVAAVIVLVAYGSDKSADLVTNQNWQQFAGATTTREGLRIQSLDRVIIHQDGSLGQPSPPVNLAGVHLAVSGDFRITARMENIDARGTLRLYGKPPVVYDQWRFETGSVAIDVATGTVTMRIWDGSSSNSNDERIYPFALKNSVSISIEHLAGTLIASADGQELGTIPDHHIFDSKEVWFGADAAQGDDWILGALKVEPLSSGHIEIVPPSSYDVAHDDPDALRNLAAAHPRKLRMGAAVVYSALVTDPEYRKLALGEFSMITPENGMKPQFIHPQQDVYSFIEMDTLVNIALQNDMLVHGHALVYAKSSPEWMTDSPKEELQEIMVNHVATVVGHFKGRVAEWDVVNEPLSNKKAPYRDERHGLDRNTWYEAMGEQYIDLAFRTAHKADPSAELYLNDYGLERDGERWDALLGLVKRLKNRGVPVDGIGFESHVYGDGDYNEASTLRAHMQTLATLGLKVRISEIDVTGDDPEAQINQYVVGLDVCLRALNCTGYSTWGVTDLYGSTTRSDRYPTVYGTSLLFDTNLKAKPAYSALQKRLRQLY